MDVSEQLLEDLRTGRIDAQRLVDLIATLQQQLHAAQQRNTELEQRIAALEQQRADLSGPAKIDEAFSMRAEEKPAGAARNASAKTKSARRVTPPTRSRKPERGEDVILTASPATVGRRIHGLRLSGQRAGAYRTFAAREPVRLRPRRLTQRIALRSSSPSPSRSSSASRSTKCVSCSASSRI
jgi:hypothetical protein